MRRRVEFCRRSALLGPVAALAFAILAGASHAEASPGQVSPEAWLEGIERKLVGLSGLPLQLRVPSDGSVRHVVFYAPLATVWQLEGRGTDVARAGRVQAITAEHGSFVGVFWETGEISSVGWPDPMPEISASGGAPHALAGFHDRLLSKPLGSAIGAVPAGSRFVPVVTSGAGGIVERSDSLEGATLWESLGDYIAITHPDGTGTVHDWREIDAALEGGEG